MKSLEHCLSWSGPNGLLGVCFLKRHYVPFDEISLSCTVV